MSKYLWMGLPVPGYKYWIQSIGPSMFWWYPNPQWRHWFCCGVFLQGRTSLSQHKRYGTKHKGRAESAYRQGCPSCSRQHLPSPCEKTRQLTTLKAQNTFPYWMGYILFGTIVGFLHNTCTLWLWELLYEYNFGKKNCLTIIGEKGVGE